MYDFDTVIDRRDTDSIKWNVGEGVLPMWVADMDFETAPEIKSDIISRAENGIFGYGDIPDSWYQAYSDWWETRHGFVIDKKRLIFCTGIIPAISSAVRKFTTPAEKVVILTPVYNIFYNCIKNNGRNALECPLVYEGGKYKIDFDDLAKKLADPESTLLILSNPHNPVGRTFTEAELSRIAELAEENGVLVISDEIHCDLTAPGVGYIPYASVSESARENSITCLSPTKAFNIAGIQTAAVYAANDKIYNRIKRALNTDEVAEPNAFAVTAAISAFTKGARWLDELRGYIDENKRAVWEFIRSRLPLLHYVPQNATYLCWIDISRLGYEGDFAEFLRKKHLLFVSAGKTYGRGGEGFIRINVACPRATLDEGLARLEAAVNDIMRN